MHKAVPRCPHSRSSLVVQNGAPRREGRYLRVVVPASPCLTLAESTPQAHVVRRAFSASPVDCTNWQHSHRRSRRDRTRYAGRRSRDRAPRARRLASPCPSTFGVRRDGRAPAQTLCVTNQNMVRRRHLVGVSSVAEWRRKAYGMCLITIDPSGWTRLHEPREE